jgi:hypothetical protein
MVPVPEQHSFEVPTMLRPALLTVLSVMFMAACSAPPPPAEQPVAQSAAATAEGQEWQVRLDMSQSATDPDNTPDIEFTPMGTTGFRYVGGPAGTLWVPGQTASGNYTLAATFTQNTRASHASFYGLVFAGSNLGEATQRYLYFQVAQNGTFLIKERTGEDTAELEGGETMHEAVRVPAEGGSAVNQLEVRVTGDAVSFVVNGTVVRTAPRTGVFAMMDGAVGARVNHVLDVTVSDFRVQ